MSSSIVSEAFPVELPEPESGSGRAPVVLDLRDVSPELVLVDPELAALVRASLPGVPTWTPTAAKPVTRPATEPELTAETDATAALPPRERRRVIRVGHALLVFAVAFAVTLGVVEVGRHWRSTARPSARSSSSIPIPRRLAWVPTADASGYDVRVRRQNRTVFVAVPTGPTVIAPLAPGDYRWTVRVVGGQSDGRLVVDARLVVYPSR